MQVPTVGRVVYVLVAPSTNNGSDVAPAEITRVWSEAADGSYTVNYRVTLDADGPLPWITSGSLCADEQTARASGRAASYAAFWPPRS